MPARDWVRNKTINVIKRCPVCSEPAETVIDVDRFYRWRGGEFVQDVFPEMSPGEREQLISGTHEKCWGWLYDQD